MRSPFVLALAAAAVAAISTPSAAETARPALTLPYPIVVSPQPIRTLAPWVEITDFEQAPYDTAHPEWFRYSVSIKNASPVLSASGNLHFENASTGLSGTVPYSAGPGQTVSVIFEDDEVFLACMARSFDLWLDGAGADAQSRVGMLDTSCSFSVPVQDSLNLLTPDMRSRYRAGHVSLSNAAASNSSCDGTTLTLDVVNETSTPQAALAITLSETTPLGQTLFKQITVPTIVAGGYVQATVNVSQLPSNATIQLVDLAHEAPITSQAITLSEQWSCTAFTQLF